MGCRNTGPSKQWAVGRMGVGEISCRNNGLSELRPDPDVILVHNIVSVKKLKKDTTNIYF